MSGLIGQGADAPGAYALAQESNAPTRPSDEVIAQKIQEQRNYELRHKFDLLCQAQAIRDDTKLMDEIRQWVKGEKAKLNHALDSLGM